ncbi:protein EIN4 [Rhodamnia argentea]|uniref:Ethylene receptor n=1 Tax=Rhodamnia argentea TaxID=178133 RepID=A0A8B8PJH6_9MYRT|nr:protein EIN4 [Rhodamnia argentea]XP_048128369.1 protein EIN4 [Rhodamnia argentea]XP_048128371.1 protein EIN4 [Rhodamnia argentea]XP_048128372.1 protein EIN4 [Rhodamnia argentea]XP_048128374.1 protein EIN4 [Rhodamnia argentea]
MLRAVALGLLLSSLTVCAYADGNGFSCCDDEGFWSVERILECQRVSDFLIAVAYFSIPLELLYFVSLSYVPFKWVLAQFIAFIVLCGLTHLLNGWTYYGPHSFQLMLSLTIAKFLTALVSCATAITLLTLIPLLLKVKVRETFLRQNVLELDQEVEMMKRQKEASWHVRMLTQEIRKSLDKHTILYTTLVELSKTLDLHNCAVWMPNDDRTEMIMTHELKLSSGKSRSIPINNANVIEIKESKGVRILRPDSALAVVSSGGLDELGAVAAIRMPMLRASNFKGGTPQSIDTHYAILVLVLPQANPRDWSDQEMEIVEVVADQVAVALSHATVLEESHLMREKLAEQNRALQQARRNAMMASQARNSFQKVMSHGMRRPMHSIVGLLSILHEENMNPEQKLIVDAMETTSNVLSTLINDVMEISAKDDGKFPFEMKHFQLHAMIREASCLAKCLCVYRGCGFEISVRSSLPDQVMGDERRTFQVILHLVGYLLDIYDGGANVTFRVSCDDTEGKHDKTRGPQVISLSNEFVTIKFEIEIVSGSAPSGGLIPGMQSAGRNRGSDNNKDALSFNVCKKLVQMMQGNIWIASSSRGLPQRMTLVLRFLRQNSRGKAMLPPGNPMEQQSLDSLFRGLRVLIADDDDINRTVTKKLLERLGCQVTSASTGLECLSALSHTDNSLRVVFLDLHMPDMDGFEVAMRIRKCRSRHWPLIIALTASAEERIWERCLQMGMNGVLWKPVVLQQVADEVRRVLQRAGEAV